MSSIQDNIYPVFDQLLKRADKERLLEQSAQTFWLTGLSGSGKTTIAKGLEKKLHQIGYLCYVLDGDNIRSGINKNLTFTLEDRVENIRRIAEVNKLINDCGVITINSFVSPTREIRQMAREIIGEAYNEVYVHVSLETAEARDVKGLYKKARAGEIKNFTGIDSPFEKPDPADITIDTETQSVEESIEYLFNAVLPKLKIDLS